MDDHPVWDSKDTLPIAEAIRGCGGEEEYRRRNDNYQLDVVNTDGHGRCVRVDHYQLWLVRSK